MDEEEEKSNSMIEIKDITKTYKMGTTSVHALRGVSLTIEDGDFVAIMGPSGSGKSTLAHILGLLDVPSTGSYKLNQKEVAQLSEDELALLRRDEIGFIFQQFNLLPRLSAYENVLLPIFYSKKETGQSDAEVLLDKVGIKVRSDHKPNELSGGQQQRVAIARSLINRPRMILADEPTGNLDSVSEKEIMKILTELNDQGITVVMVTHEESIGKQAKRLIRMRDGVIQSDERLKDISGKKNHKSSKDDSANNKNNPFAFLKEIYGHLDQGLKTLIGNKIRTALSVLGILIGVAAVIAMLALGTGAQKAIEQQLSSLGSNLLVLRSGHMRIGGVVQQEGQIIGLLPDDAPLIKKNFPEVLYASPSVDGRAQVSYQNKNWSTEVLGTTPVYTAMKSAVPIMGRFFTEAENTSRARVAVVGATIVRELYNGENPVGKTIKINKSTFQVIGVLPEKGATGWRDQDDVVVVPLATAMYRLLGTIYVKSIDLQIADSKLIDSAQENILQFMYTKKRIPLSQRENALEIRNLADIQQALTQSNKTMTTLLASIAAISLLVGGIGIMNIMLVSVTERTKEIGLRKAIGAKKIDILMQFLVESIVVSVVGGVAGIVLGWSICVTLGKLTGWNTSISPESVLLSFLFSAVIGIIFGIYPAKKASGLNPIDALRYE